MYISWKLLRFSLMTVLHSFGCLSSLAMLKTKFSPQYALSLTPLLELMDKSFKYKDCLRMLCDRAISVIHFI